MLKPPGVPPRQPLLILRPDRTALPGIVSKDITELDEVSGCLFFEFIEAATLLLITP
jgi:hypothetical protein